MYEIEDLQGIPTEGHFYSEELTLVVITPRTVYKIDKILKQRYATADAKSSSI